jgi:hypothetical protein
MPYIECDEHPDDDGSDEYPDTRRNERVRVVSEHPRTLSQDIEVSRVQRHVDDDRLTIGPTLDLGVDAVRVMQMINDQSRIHPRLAHRAPHPRRAHATYTAMTMHAMIATTMSQNVNLRSERLSTRRHLVTDPADRQ